MFLKRALIAAAALCMLLTGIPRSYGAQVDSGDIYCFGTGDFSGEELAGICITGLPDRTVGTALLDQRVLRPGDVLSVQQLERMTFVPVRSEQDGQAVISYLPVFAGGGVGPRASMTISIRGKENQPPVAEDFAAETYKNLPIDGKLKVKDPEGENMTFSVLRQPKRGTLELREDGSFTYTPKKNKVGIDSFVYTATDAAGKVSRECTVTITIVKPTDSTQYTDTLGHECRFAAEWMKNTGIFVGEKLDGHACFSPDKPVTGGQFVTMLVRTLEIPLDRNGYDALPADTPSWLQPYLAAAIRSGITAGVEIHCDEPITGQDAARMIHNALDLPDTAQAGSFADPAPASPQEILAQYGIRLDTVPLTRSQAAQALYQVSRLAREAPGMVVIAKQR